MLVTHRILTAQQGENAPTPRDPVGIVLSEDGPTVTYRRAHREEVATADLREIVACCAYWDDDRLVDKEKYEVVDVVLPDWLSVDEWLWDPTAWKWTWGFGVDPLWPEAWQRGLRALPNTQRLAAVKLLKTKAFRSDFRKSLCDQIKGWLNTPADERKFSSPLSPKQWGYLVDARLAREANSYDLGLYRNKGFRDARVAA